MSSNVGGRTAHHNAPPDLPIDFFSMGHCSRELDILQPHERADIMCSDDRTEMQTAKAICSRCPVEIECLEWALAVGQEGCTHARIHFSQRFLTRFRQSMTRMTIDGIPEDGSPVTIRTTANSTFGAPGHVVAVSRPVAAALVAARLAERLVEVSA